MKLKKVVAVILSGVCSLNLALFSCAKANTTTQAESSASAIVTKVSQDKQNQESTKQKPSKNEKKKNQKSKPSDIALKITKISKTIIFGIVTIVAGLMAIGTRDDANACPICAIVATISAVTCADSIVETVRCFQK